MTYDDILKALFESRVLPTGKTLSASSASGAFEPNESHPFDWAVDDPIVACAEPDLVASQLRRKINYGVLDPTSAEAQARAHGCAPLNAPPSPEAFDVASRTRWTLTMGLAWVMWRSFDAVRAVEAEWIAAHQTWVEWTPTGGSFDSSSRHGWVLLPIMLAPLAVLRELDADGIEGALPQTKLDVATKELWAALLDRKLGSEGRLETGEWTEIAPVEWNDLRHTTSARRPRDWFLGSSRNYSDVLISASAVTKEWSPAFEARCVGHKDFNQQDKLSIIASVERFLRDRSNAKKEEISKHLMAEGWSFSRRFFDQRIWEDILQALPDRGLARAGRRRKSPS